MLPNARPLLLRLPTIPFSRPSPSLVLRSRRAFSKMAQQNTKFEGGSSATHNPHPDFKSVEATRPPFDPSLNVRFTKTIDPDWKTSPAPTPSASPPPRTSPSTRTRRAAPRASTTSSSSRASSRAPSPSSPPAPPTAPSPTSPPSATSTNHRAPPLFVVGFAASVDKPKDSLKCLLESKECVINIISEGFLEAANATSVNAPYGKSEWDVSGLTPVSDCKHVKAARVKEAIFSIEGVLDSFKEYDSRATPGKKSGVVCIIEGKNFWVREDAINEQRNIIDPTVLRPVSRLGGITYGRTTEVLEIPRADWDKNIGGEEGYEKIKNGQ
uniref:Flavoprotein oxygenase n=1 Tax=Colletotrichum fructicola (strain Nara gc5) TaxID=1213859 RepID=L2FS44_COLFN